ncbi:MAG: hypothetical protein Q7S53_01185 [bacterium]|nr:hypothetical protein [bacterium]
MFGYFNGACLPVYWLGRLMEILSSFGNENDQDLEEATQAVAERIADMVCSRGILNDTIWMKTVNSEYSQRFSGLCELLPTVNISDWKKLAICRGLDKAADIIEETIETKLKEEKTRLIGDHLTEESEEFHRSRHEAEFHVFNKHCSKVPVVVGIQTRFSYE